MQYSNCVFDSGAESRFNYMNWKDLCSRKLRGKIAVISFLTLCFIRWKTGKKSYAFRIKKNLMLLP